MTSCLVTGAAGFIGSHTCAALLARGDTVVGLDNINDYYEPHRKLSNVREIETPTGTNPSIPEPLGDYCPEPLTTDRIVRAMIRKSSQRL